MILFCFVFFHRRRESALEPLLKRAEATAGIFEVLEKLEVAMRNKGLTWQDLDQDGSGDLDADELVDGLIQLGLDSDVFSRREGRLLVDLFDGNGDGIIEEYEFTDVMEIVRRRALRRATQAKRDKRRAVTENRKNRRLSYYKAEDD